MRNLRLERRIDLLDEYEALLDRVHAECGPYRVVGIDPKNPDIAECKSCGVWSFNPNAFASMVHTPDCLWLAVDELKRKAGKSDG